MHANCAQTSAGEGPERNGRGLFVIGPQLVSGWDVIIRLMALSPEWTRYLEEPREARRQMRQRREAAKAKALKTRRFLAAHNGKRTRNTRVA